MPLPGTHVIPAGWSQHHRPTATGGMNATVQLTGPLPAAVTNPDTLATTRPASTVVWAGLARIQAQTSRPREGDLAGQPITLHRYLVQLDITGTGAAAVPDGVVPGWRVLVTTCPNDPALAGQALHILDVQHGSERFVRDLVCELNDLSEE